MPTPNEDDSTNANDKEILTQKALGHLDDEYENMSKKRDVLLQMLRKLQLEEASLAKAQTLSQTQAKKPVRPQNRDAAAVLRLEQALLAAGDSGDDESTII